MTLSRVSVTNATHRVAWCRSGKLNERSGLRRLFLQSPTAAPPRGAPRTPHNALSNPLPDFLSQRYPPPEPWKLNGCYGALYRELRALYDHRPTEQWGFLTQAGTVPPTTHAVAPQARSYETKLSARPARPAARQQHSLRLAGSLVTPALQCAKRNLPGHVITTTPT